MAAERRGEPEIRSLAVRLAPSSGSGRGSGERCRLSGPGTSRRNRRYRGYLRASVGDRDGARTRAVAQRKGRVRGSVARSRGVVGRKSVAERWGGYESPESALSRILALLVWGRDGVAGIRAVAERRGRAGRRAREYGEASGQMRPVRLGGNAAEGHAARHRNSLSGSSGQCFAGSNDGGSEPRWCGSDVRCGWVGGERPSFASDGLVSAPLGIRRRGFT